MLKKIKVKKGSTVPSPLFWSDTITTDGTKKFAMTGLVDDCGILPETKFWDPPAHGQHRGLTSREFPSPLGSCQRA